MIGVAGLTLARSVLSQSRCAAPTVKGRPLGLSSWAIASIRSIGVIFGPDQ